MDVSYIYDTSHIKIPLHSNTILRGLDIKAPKQKSFHLKLFAF